MLKRSTLVTMILLSVWLFTSALLLNALIVTQVVEKSAFVVVTDIMEDTVVDTGPVLISASSIQTTTIQQEIVVISAFATSIEALFVILTAAAHVTAPSI